MRNVIVLAEYQAVSTGRQGKLLGQNVYGTGRTTRWKQSRDKVIIVIKVIEVPITLGTLASGDQDAPEDQEPDLFKYYDPGLDQITACLDQISIQILQILLGKIPWLTHNTIAYLSVTLSYIVPNLYCSHPPIYYGS